MSKRKKKRKPAGRGPRSRRVVLQRPPDRDDFGTRVLAGGNVQAWGEQYQRASGSGFKTYPIVRLTEDGIDWGTKPQPRR